RRTVQACIERGIEYLTVFAFSSENWRRPPEEVSLLMQLFHGLLSSEITRLHRNSVRLKVVGDLSRFDAGIRALIENGENLTAGNRKLTLTIAANYGGRWDVLQALSRLAREHPEAVAQGVEEAVLAPYLSMAYAPEPDLFIRTGGEKRISNFLLWQLAYSELYFTDTLWPDFGVQALDTAIRSYRQRERRFGRTSEQLREALGTQTAAPDEPPAASAIG
ncbi:MAG: polyprenyl diphosphate synthase, partial [Betaproteobacteria bacterium]|nr:polyprenyl diphosphate synthase [Betaproteobacteria bacterium]